VRLRRTRRGFDRRPRYRARLSRAPPALGADALAQGAFSARRLATGASVPVTLQSQSESHDMASAS